jgi:hypothetical protein
LVNIYNHYFSNLDLALTLADVMTKVPY